MNPAAIVSHLRLARSEGVGPVTYRRLLARFADADAALRALPELARAGGRASPPVIPDIRSVERELAQLARIGGTPLFLGGPHYPPFLALLDDAPPVIAVLGDPALLSAPCVALVGARNASANGRRMAEGLAAELAGAGFAIVSGLARGIDASAHAGAMTRGRTIAVIAGGLDQPYPPEHAELQHAIAVNGAVIAEAPLGTAPQARHFPRRNRIIAGLSLGVVVVEAALRSGSLITARMAQDAHREIFAMPGSPLDPRARGSNDLIRQGAHLTETLADVLANLPDHPDRQGLGRDPLFARNRVLPDPVMPDRVLPDRGGLSETPAAPFAASATASPDNPYDQARARAQILELLGPAPSSVDDLIRRCQFSAASVMAVLLELELAGRAETLSGNRVALLPD